MDRRARRNVVRSTTDGRTVKLTGIGGIDNPAYLQTANPGGAAGDAAGFFYAMLCIPRSLGATNVWMQRSSGVAGAQIRQTAATTLAFTCANGVGTLVNSPAYTATPSLGRVTGIVGVHDGTNVRLYVDRLEIGSGSAIVGYTSLSSRTFFGAAGSSVSQFDFFGACTGHAVPSQANVEAWFDAVKLAKACVAMPVVANNHLWVTLPTLTAPTDTVGSNNLSLAGSGHTMARIRSPNWGW